jgi:hypothetical protein
VWEVALELDAGWELAMELLSLAEEEELEKKERGWRLGLEEVEPALGWVTWLWSLAEESERK